MRWRLTLLLIVFVFCYPSIGNTHDNFKKLWSDRLGDYYLELDTIMSVREGLSKTRPKSDIIPKLNEFPKDHNWFNFYVIDNFMWGEKTENFISRKRVGDLAHTVLKGTFMFSKKSNYGIQCSSRQYLPYFHTFHEFRFGKGSITKTFDESEGGWKTFSELEAYNYGPHHVVVLMIQEACGLELRDILFMILL